MIEPGVIEPGVIEPGVIEPGVIEPGVIEPGVIEPGVIEAAPAHAAILAKVHAAAFPDGEQWNAQAFADMLAMPGAFGFIDERGGFIMARMAGGEAEILTLAVAPPSRRQGIARDLVAAVVAAVAGAPLFLEAAAGNEPALCLYRAAGFTACGQRRGYYGPGRDAVVLRR